MKRFPTRAVPLVLALLLVFFCGEGTRKGRLTILMYHDFTQESQPLNDWTLPIERFREDLQWLTDHGYAFYLPRELASGVPLAPRAVMLTFDDGYLSNYTLAYPLLKEYGAKAAIAVVCGMVDREANGILTWEMCREMADSGLVEIGSHTYDCHQEEPLGITRMAGESREDYQARVFPDLLKSQEVIAGCTGQPAGYLAYPNGKTEPWCAEFVRERFYLTVTTMPRIVRPGQELYNLGRYNMAPSVRPATVLRDPTHP